MTKDNLLATVEPDYPCPFGYKTVWYVVKDDSPLSVIEKLNLDIMAQSNWENGINAVYKKDAIFVSPSLDGYILVVGLVYVAEDQEIVKEHSFLFDELQYFASHRIVDYHAWAKFVDHNLIRAYTYIGESGEITWNEGDITIEELKLGFDTFPASDDSSWDEVDLPNEESVLDISKAWGIDTSFTDKTYEKSTGYLCRIKEH